MVDCNDCGVGAGAVSREPEVRAIAEFLSQAAGTPTGLVLEGEAGIGKTTLWLDGIKRATALGFRVLSARGSPAEARSTFAAASDLLSDVDAALLAELPPPQRSALDRMLLRGDDGPATDERAVATAFLSAIERLARESPVLLAIDDTQWLDAASSAVIGFAAHRLKGPIGVLATTRTDDPDISDITPFLRLPHPDAITRVRVGPLSLGGLHAVIAGRIGRTLPRIAIGRVHQISGGNPFYALELARVLGDRPVVGTDLPGSLAVLVSRRLGDIDQPTNELLLAVASASDPTVDLLSRALDVTPGAVVDALERVETLGIVEYRSGRVQFTHPLLAHGVYSQADAPRRRRTHRALAAVVEDSELRARHLALAATTGDAATVEALDAAADVAVNRGAPGSAAELIELAIGLGADTVLRRLQAAELYFRAGALVAAYRMLPSKIEEVPTGPLRCLALMLTGAMRAYDDDMVSAVEAMTQALDEADDNAALRAQCAMRIALGLHMIGRLHEAVEYSELSVKLADELGVPALRSQARAFWVSTSFVSGRGLDQQALRTAVELEDPDSDATTWFRASAVAAMISAWTGDLDGARTQLCAVQQRMRDGGTELDIIWAANQLSKIDVWLGRYAEAEASARESLQRAEQMGGRQLLISAWNVEAEAAARTGREGDARSAAGASMSAVQDSGARNMAIAPMSTLAFLEVSLANYAAALTVLEPLLAEFDPAHGTEIAERGYLPDAIEALVGVGRLDDAEPLIAALEDNGLRFGRDWMRAVGSRGRAQMCAARGDLDGAERALEQALASHDRMAMPFERARTELLQGQIRRRRRRRQQAETTLTAAAHTFEAIGSPLWAARARHELDRLSVRTGAGTGLTDAEHRVAHRAAEGLSNKEIAALLFLSPKTVEMYLSAVYRKLGIRSRAQLASRLPVDHGPENP